MDNDLLTPIEVAELLKISKYTVYEMVKRDELPAIKLGRKVRIKKQDVLKYLDNAKTNGRAAREKVITPFIHQEIEEPIFFMGSHDLSLDYVVDHINQHYKQMKIIPAFLGSMEGLYQLYQDKTQIAGCHLFDEETGQYNIPFIKRLFLGEKVFVIEFLKRNLGWVIAKGNPKNVVDWNDLHRKELRYVNRQKGAGTRVILDYNLKNLGIEKTEINGYERIERTHYGVAGAIGRGEGDFGLATESVAIALGLDFIPLVKERYDLVMKANFYQSEQWQYFKKALHNKDLKLKIESLGGYDVTQMGELIQEV